MRQTIQEGDPATLSMLHVNDVYPEEIPRTTMPPTLLRDHAGRQHLRRQQRERLSPQVRAALNFQTVSRTGKTVDSGVILRGTE
jgi:hypothetical protein